MVGNIEISLVRLITKTIITVPYYYFENEPDKHYWKIFI